MRCGGDQTSSNCTAAPTNLSKRSTRQSTPTLQAAALPAVTKPNHGQGTHTLWHPCPSIQPNHSELELLGVVYRLQHATGNSCTVNVRTNHQPHNQQLAVTISTLYCCCCCRAELLQNFVTSLLPAHLGNESLGVLYIVVCLTVFLAPVVVDRLGARPTMVLGAACFCVYLASLIHVQRLVVLAAAVVIGFGAAILWVAFGGKPT